MSSKICEAIDLEENPGIFIRKIKNYSLTLANNKLLEINRSIKLDCIKYRKLNTYFMSNSKIGVLDVETFKNNKGLGQVYCLGYCTLDNRDKINTYYLSDLDSLNSNMLIINCINTMLEPRYHGYIWYIHNMGKFDMVYIYKTLEEYNLNYKQEYYKLKTIYKNGKMLKLEIKRKIKSKEIKITFLDSYNILSNSLEKLTRDFEVETVKGVFPYSYVNESNLDYIGETPDIKYYKNISISPSKSIRQFTQKKFGL